MTWTPLALFPGLWVAALLAGLGFILRRAYDAVPRAAWASLALLLAILLGPALLGGRVLLPLGYLEAFAPFAEDAVRPPDLERGVSLQGDLVLQIAPWSTQVRAACVAGRWPLWNPYAGAGVPLWSNPQAQSLQPLQLLALLFPVAQAAGVLAALRIALAFLFTVLFLRRFGFGELAALGGGLVFALGGYLQGWLGWPLATSAAYLPLLLYAALRVDQVARRRDTLLVAAAGFGLATGGHPETAFYVALLALLFGLALSRRRAAGEGLRLLRSGATAALLAASLAAPLLLPAARALAGSQRAAQLESRHARMQAEGGSTPSSPQEGSRETAPAVGERPWSGVALRLAGLVAPLAAGDNLRGGYWGDRNVINDTAGFAGTAAGLLCLLAFLSPGSKTEARAQRGRLVLAFAALAAVVVIARPPGLVRLFDLLPVLRDSASFHSRLSLWLDFGIAVGAAFTIDRWRRGSAPSRRAIALVAAALAVVVLCAYAALDRPELRALRLAALAGQLAALALAASALTLPRTASGERVAAALLLLALTVEPVALRWKANCSAPRSAFFPPNPALDALVLALRPGERIVGLGGALRANVATVYGLGDPRLNDPAKPASYVDALSSIRRNAKQSWDELENPGSPLYRFLGVRFALVPPRASLPPPFRLLRADAGAAVFERPDPLPLLFWPASVELCAARRPWSECTAPITDFGALPWCAGPRAPSFRGVRPPARRRSGSTSFRPACTRIW